MRDAVWATAPQYLNTSKFFGVFVTHADINPLTSSCQLNANVFRKTLRMSPRARIEHPKGQITNLFSEDSELVVGAAGMLHTLVALFSSSVFLTISRLWVSPIQIAIGVYLLLHMVGRWAQLHA